MLVGRKDDLANHERCIFSCIANSKVLMKLLIVDVGSSSLPSVSMMMLIFTGFALAFLTFFIVDDDRVLDGAFDFGGKLVNILEKSLVGGFSDTPGVPIFLFALLAVILTDDLIDSNLVLASTSSRDKRSSHNSNGSLSSFTVFIIVNIFEFSEDWNVHLGVFMLGMLLVALITDYFNDLHFRTRLFTDNNLSDLHFRVSLITTVLGRA
jgi:hypothetical protein